MLKSMTACGRAHRSFSIGDITVEISSVNRKFREVQISLPRECLRFDVPIKKRVSERVLRGHLQIKISITYHDSYPIDVIPNVALAKKIAKGWGDLCQELGITWKSEDLLSVLEREPSVLSYEEEKSSGDQLQEAVIETVEAALDELLAMKEGEGAELQRDMAARLQMIEEMLPAIREHAEAVVGRYREKISERLKEFGVSLEKNQDQLLREVCLYAERADITEELTRLTAHLKLLKELMKGKEQLGGKKLEFLLQEMHREITTIAAKAGDVAVAHLTVEVRAELEKIREQVQNVE